jgi:zinc/manganese transport system ATP-binding protein
MSAAPLLAREAEPVLAFRNLTLGYDRHPAVHHLDGEVRRGDLLALIGPNGAGKSTLLKGIVGEVARLDGELGLLGAARSDIAYLPQRADIDLGFPISVYDLVSTGLWRRTGAWGAIGRSAQTQIAGALARVGLEGFERRAIGTLSGGQTQRALFARTILQDARIILLDEPFTAVDTRTAEDLLDLVASWHHEGRTVIAALHDLDQVRARFPRTLLLAREPVAWGPTRAVVTDQNLARARHLVEAWDESGELCHRTPPVRAEARP